MSRKTVTSKVSKKSEVVAPKGNNNEANLTALLDNIKKDHGQEISVVSTDLSRCL